MFSRVSVDLFTGGDISGPMSFLGVGISGTRSLPGGGSVQWVGGYVQGRGGYVQGVPSWTWDLRRGVRIPQDTVGKQAVHILLDCCVLTFKLYL